MYCIYLMAEESTGFSFGRGSHKEYLEYLNNQNNQNICKTYFHVWKLYPSLLLLGAKYLLNY